MRPLDKSVYCLFSNLIQIQIQILHVYVDIGYHLYNYSLDCHNGNVCALAIMKSSPSFNQKKFGPIRSEFYTFSPVRSVWSGPKNIHNRLTQAFGIIIL